MNEPILDLDVVTLANVEPEDLDWLWRGRIARGKVTMIVGNPGDGKSYLTLGIAAALSHGRALPDGEQCEPADTLLWNGEDGLADTIRVRAERVGADLDRVHVVQSATAADGNREPFGLQHLDQLADEIERRPNVGLVVIDPLSALLGGIDPHKDSQVRSMLQPLADFARHTGVAVVVVAHLNKGTATHALYRVVGSIGFTALARSVLLVARDQDTGRRAIAQMKNNLAADVPSVEFSIDNTGLQWGGIAHDLNTNRLLAAPETTEATKLDDAKGVIMTLIEDANSDILGVDLDRAVIAAGFTRKTYERARADLRRDGKINRDGGNQHGPIRWSALRHDANTSVSLAETRTMAETTSALGQDVSSRSYISALGHPDEFTRARARTCPRPSIPISARNLRTI